MPDLVCICSRQDDKGRLEDLFRCYGAATSAMLEMRDLHAFLAEATGCADQKLSAYLQAMLDPAGKGVISFETLQHETAEIFRICEDCRRPTHDLGQLESQVVKKLEKALALHTVNDPPGCIDFVRQRVLMLQREVAIVWRNDCSTKPTREALHEENGHQAGTLAPSSSLPTE